MANSSQSSNKETVGQVLSELENGSGLKKAKNYWHSLGPGLVTGASDDDPSGIATYSQAGAGFGLNLLWLSLFTFPFMAIVQEMCARIGLVTGRGLAANIRHHYPRWILYLCTLALFAANSFNIGADIGAMASATRLLLPDFSFGLLVVAFALVSLTLEVFVSYKKYSQILKWLSFILLFYVASAFLIKLNWGEVLFHAIIPSITFSKQSIFMICAILGTTISPYLFFWQTSQEVEEEILEGKTTLKLRREVSKSELKVMRKDVWSGMFFSNLVMFFIIVACAATLFGSGLTNIQTASDAALALRPIAGNAAYFLFALGIIGTGMLAIPVLAGSVSYAISESMGWKFGLYRKLKEAGAFYGVIVFSTLLGVAMNFIGLDPIKALIYSAVANGLIAPIILLLIIRLSSNTKVMGEHTNKPLTSMFGYFVTAVMAVSSIAAIVSVIF